MRPTFFWPTAPRSCSPAPLHMLFGHRPKSRAHSEASLFDTQLAEVIAAIGALTVVMRALHFYAGKMGICTTAGTSCSSGGEPGPSAQTGQAAIGARGLALLPSKGVAGEGTASRVDGVDGTGMGETSPGGQACAAGD